MLRQVYRIRRKLFPRNYPTTLIFIDGSTVTVRHHEPKHIIKYPLTYEECVDAQSKKAWQTRRRAVVAEAIKREDEDISFDARKYLRQRKR